MNVTHILMAILIALPVVSWAILGLKILKRKREQGLVVDLGDEAVPADLNDVKSLPLRRQARFLVAAVLAGLFLMHIPKNDADAHNDQEELEAYRAYISEPYNVEAIKRIAKGGPIIE